MGSKLVEFEGSSSSSGIYIVGEAPGENEVRSGRPFTGASGHLLDKLLMQVGVLRTECRLANVMRERPSGNNFTNFYQDKSRRYPSPSLLEGIEFLSNDIREHSPNLILALGNEPLRALTPESGITKWRGSILYSKKVECKLIPTIHPSALLRTWGYVPLVIFDLQRAKEEALTPVYVEDVRDFILNPSLPQIHQSLSNLHSAEFIGFDVETDEKGCITCIALSSTPRSAICIPFTVDNGVARWEREEERDIWLALKKLLETKHIKKIAQNAQFDMIMLLKNPYHINVAGLYQDTMCAHHTLYPEIAASKEDVTEKRRTGGGKSLGIICSIYTKHPYYKHLAHTSDNMTYWKYNCLDAAITLEAAHVIEGEMKEFEVFDFYYKYVHPLLPILADMQVKGMKIDEEVRLKAVKDYTQKLSVAQSLLNETLSRDVNVLSPKQLQQLLYEDMNLPPKYKRGTKSLTTDEEALKELSRKHPSAIFDLILEIRQCTKILSTYLKKEKVGTDGRMRCSYMVGSTTTGRLASRKSVFGTGTNLQNVPPGVCRQMFVADEGKILLSPDLAQADARIVAYVANEPAMIEVFESGTDIHQLIADTLPPSFVPTGSSYQNVPNPRRLFGKKHVHAFNYGESIRMFAARANIPTSIAAVIRDKYFADFPNILTWQQDVRGSLFRKKTLVTPLGRKRTFFGRWDSNLFMAAYAYVPQSTVSDILNRALINFVDSYANNRKDMDMFLQVHDSFLFQVDNTLPAVEHALLKIKEAFNIPFYVEGKRVLLPVDTKIGKNWQDMKDIKYPIILERN